MGFTQFRKVVGGKIIEFVPLSMNLLTCAVSDPNYYFFTTLETKLANGEL
jgi:hypothetical protein